MKKKSLTKNYLYNLIYQVLVLILPLITTPYVSRVLGAERIGIYGYTLSITTFFIIFGSLGITTYGQREIAYLQDDKKKYSKVFWEIFIFRFIAMSISMMVFYVSFVLFENDYSVYYRILMLEIIGEALDISWFFQGLEEFKKTVLRNLLVKLTCVVCVFVFVKTKEDIFKYFWIYALSIFLGNGSLWINIHKYLDKTYIKQLNIIKHLKPTIGLFIPQIAIHVYTLLDKTMIGTIIYDKSEVGFYDQSQKIIKILLSVVTSIGTVMLPRISNTFAKGNTEQIKGYLKKSFNVIFFMAIPMIFGIIAVSGNFVPMFFGKGYDRVILLMNIISPVLLIIGISNVIGVQYLLPTKRQKEYTTSVVMGAFINFICNLILIPKLGAIGASIGTLIAEITVSGTQIFFVRKELDCKKIIGLCVKYLISSIIMYFVCYIINIVMGVGTVTLFVQIVAGGLTYFVMLLIMKDEFLFEVLHRFFGKFLKR